MDFSTILVESLDWIENLDQQEVIDYRFGEGPDVFILYNSDTTERESAMDINILFCLIEDLETLNNDTL